MPPGATCWWVCGGVGRVRSGCGWSGLYWVENPNLDRHRPMPNPNPNVEPIPNPTPQPSPQPSSEPEPERLPDPLHGETPTLALTGYRIVQLPSSMSSGWLRKHANPSWPPHMRTLHVHVYRTRSRVLACDESALVLVMHAYSCVNLIRYCIQCYLLRVYYG